MNVSITITNHGNIPEGLSWFVSHLGIERGPFTQAEAIREVAAIMTYPPREEAPPLGARYARQAPRDMYDDGMSTLQDRTYREVVATLPVVDGRPFVKVTGTEAVTSDGRPVDTFGRTPEEAAFIAGVQAYRRGIRYAAKAGDWFGRGYIYGADAEARDDARRQRRQFDAYLKHGPIA